MARWKSKEERLRLGERAVYLRDVKKLQWQHIAERLGLYSGPNVVYHYKKQKALLLTVKSEMNLKQIEEFSSRYDIERGYVWLYENGFRKRVSLEVQERIEDGKFGIGARPKKSQAEFVKRDGRSTESRGKEGRRRSRQEQLLLGKRAVELKDGGLTWRQIAEQLGVRQSSSVQIYYKKYKVASPFLKEERA